MKRAAGLSWKRSVKQLIVTWVETKAAKDNGFHKKRGSEAKYWAEDQTDSQVLRLLWILMVHFHCF